ncbi:MAG: hypothetical protein FWD17_18590, partial [Polyangiaceae bacterium]|nr:hypothetical protein [Polyangiaceae bacterium]
MAFRALSVHGLHVALRDPLAQFVAVGALLVAVQRMAAAPRAAEAEDGSRRIIVDTTFTEAVVRNFERSAGHPPTDEQRARLIQDAVEEEVLFREAKAMHLDEDDPIVRRRLVQKAEFLVDDLRPIVEPSDEELAAYLTAHADTYRSPLKLAFRHVFFSTERRGSGAERDAQAAFDRLQRNREAKVEGDVFLSGMAFPERSLRDIDGLLGSGAGYALAALALLLAFQFAATWVGMYVGLALGSEQAVGQAS